MADQESGFQALLRQLQRRRVVRVAIVYAAAAFAVLQGADLVFPALGLSDRVFAMLVGSTLVGFPITLALSWVYDLTPQGWVRTSNGTEDPTGNWLGMGTLAVMIGLTFSLAAGYALSSGVPSAAERALVADVAEIETVAVMPFAHLESAEEDLYFTEGLTEELRSAIARIEGIRVAGRASTLASRHLAVDPEEAGRELGVEAILVGSVRRSGPDVRIVAELLSAADGLELWTDQYEAQVDDVFSVQARIARSISEALSLTLSPESERAIGTPPSSNVMAVDKARWGRFNWNRRTAAGLEAAIMNYQEAIAFDSLYAGAWAGLADSYILLPEFGDVDAREAIRAGRAAAERALALDADLAQAHASLGLLEMFDWEWAAAERSFRRSLALDPNYATAHQWFANMLMGQRRWAEALEEISIAEELDRLSTVIKQDAARILMNSGRTDEAISKAQETLDQDPTYAPIWSDLGYMFLAAGRFDDARGPFGRTGELTGTGAEAQLAFVDAVTAYAESGEPQALPGLETYPDPSAWLATQLFLVGQRDQALDVLERGVEQRVWDMMTIGGNSVFRALDDEPRYEALLRAVGIE